MNSTRAPAISATNRKESASAPANGPLARNRRSRLVPNSTTTIAQVSHATCPVANGVGLLEGGFETIVVQRELVGLRRDRAAPSLGYVRRAGALHRRSGNLFNDDGGCDVCPRLRRRQPPLGRLSVREGNHQLRFS